MTLRTTVRISMTIAVLAGFSLASLGCPPEKKKDDHEHKPGDGHDHDEDKQKK